MTSQITSTIETDILIIGYGGAGASAAISGHDEGAEVLIVEKSEEGGGSTRESGGSIRVLKDPQGAIEHLAHITMGKTPSPMLAAYVEGVIGLPTWLESLGAVLEPLEERLGYPPLKPFSAFPELPGADAIGGRLRVRAEERGENGGSSLWRVLHDAVRQRDIPTIYSSTTDRLLLDYSAGQVTGALLNTPNGGVEVVAKKGVILSCGGFAWSPKLQEDYFGFVFNALSPPGKNTGDGIHLALGVGADLWHMNAVAGPFGYMFPGYEAAFHHRMRSPHYIYVDSRGRRYIDETGMEFHASALAALAFDPATISYPRVPSYVIFDEKARKAGPICPGGSGWNRHVVWSEDNSVEISRGWILQADSVSELSQLIGVPPADLEGTVRRYNEYCRVGVDSDHGRQAEFLQPIDHPPYCAVPIWPTLLNTQGGPRRDENARVLAPSGQPIPRLYSAGELGSMWGMLYPGAGNISEALVYGQIAGSSAAHLTPITSHSNALDRRE